MVVAVAETNETVIGHVQAVTTRTLHGGMNAIDAKNQKRAELAVDLQAMEAMAVSAVEIQILRARASIDEIKVRCVAVAIAATIAIDHTKN